MAKQSCIKHLHFAINYRFFIQVSDLGKSLYVFRLIPIIYSPAPFSNRMSITVSLFPLPVGALLTVFRLLHRRSAAVGTGDIGLLLRLGLHLVVVFALARRTERHAAFDDLVYVHNLSLELRI